MKILFISLEAEKEIEPFRNLLKNEFQYAIIEIPTDSDEYLQIFKKEKPCAVVIRFLGAYSHRIAMNMRETGITAKFFTYTYHWDYRHVNEFALHKFDGYFHLQMTCAAMIYTFTKVMLGYVSRDNKETDLL